jgi:hypothetical protein
MSPGVPPDEYPDEYLPDEEPEAIPVAPGQESMDLTPAAPAPVQQSVDDDEFRSLVIRGMTKMATQLERIAIAVERPQPAAPAAPAGDWQLRQPPPPQGQVASTPGAPIQGAQPPPQGVTGGPIDPTQVPGYGWVCPVHGGWKVVPPGVAKTGPRAGQPYPAFIACPERGCNQKPPR